MFPDRGRRGTILRAVGAVVLVLLTVLLVAAQPLNGNLRYELGVKLASTHSAADTFSHRPLAFRWVLDGLLRSAELVGPDPDALEVGVRVLGTAVAAVAALLLWQGLSRQQVRWAGVISAVVLLATVLGGPQFSYEPDWMALVLATAGAGVALGGPGVRGRWWRVLVAAVLLVGSGAMKGVTLPIAVAGVLAVAVLAPRRLLPLLAACVAVGAGFAAVMVLWFPWEIQWLLDIRWVQDGSTPEVETVAEAAVGSALRWPALLLLPAATLLLPRRRWVPWVAVALTTLPILAQGKYYGYHFVPLSVVAAVTVLLALRDRLRVGAAVGTVLLTVLATAVSLPGERWRDAHTSALAVGSLVVVLISSGWALWARRRPFRPAGAARPTPTDRPLLAGALVVLLVLPAATPWATGIAPSSRFGDSKQPTPALREAREQTAERVHEVVGGSTTPVTYLTFGDWTYFIANPTSCRYPSPLFLQRTRWYPQSEQARSFEENLECLSDPQARWLVLDEYWFDPESTADTVAERLEQEWDCERAVEVDELTLCPRRSGTAGAGPADPDG